MLGISGDSGRAATVDRVEAADPAGPDSQAAPRAGGRLSAFAMTGVSAVLLGFLLHWRYGYTAGVGDHLVLSALGLHWADPSKFGNDWVIANAPQPHWLFDVVTWFGASIGQLSAVYLAYWLLSLLVFGAATTLLARTWAPKYAWPAVIATTVISAVTPWWLLGTGSPLYPMALPVVFAGYLIFLVTAALLTGRYKLAAFAAVATALVHVQQGGVVAVLLIVAVVLVWARTRRIDWLMLGGAAVSLAIMFTVLAVRPVAGNIGDFSKICSTIISYHCEATSWPAGLVWSGFALIGLALLTVVYVGRNHWLRWATVLVLSAFGLVVGVLVDRWNVPMLGQMAQGLNIYRLDVVLLPYAAWGVLVPIFGKLPVWARAVLLVLVGYLGFEVLGTVLFEPAYPLVEPRGGVWLLIFAVVLAAVTAVVTYPRWQRFAPWAIRGGLVVMVGCVLASMVFSNKITLKAFDPTFNPQDEIRTWGEAAEKAVPPGAQLLAPPLAIYVRLSTGRGVVVDCKNVPYGGEPWQDYIQRLDALGGMNQCYGAGSAGFDKMPAADVSDVAKRYGADYMVVEKYQKWRIPDLTAAGWTVVLNPVSNLENWVLRAPWAKTN